MKYLLCFDGSRHSAKAAVHLANLLQPNNEVIVFVGYEIGDLAKLVEQLDMEKEQYDAQVQ
jgi:hypothetical protein